MLSHPKIFESEMLPLFCDKIREKELKGEK